MKKRIVSLILCIMCLISTFVIVTVPAQAAGETSIVTLDGQQFSFYEFRTSWSYAVYLARTTGREVIFKLCQDYYPWTSSGSIKFNGTKYKYSKYDFGVNIRACDIGMGLASTDKIDAFRKGAIFVPSGAKITIDLNGFCLDRREGSKTRDDGEVINVASGGTLTIIDSNPYANHGDYLGGGIIGGSSGDGAGGIHVNGTLNMKAGTIYKCNTDEHGGGIYVNGGTVNITGGGIVKCETDDSWDNCHGGGIYVDGGRCNISNCVIRNCDSEDDGGAIYVDSGKLVCRNVRFLNNHANDEGGAVYIWEGTSEFDGCTFSSNSTSDGDNGGALYINTRAKYKHSVKNCVFDYNTAGDGGAIFIDDGEVEIINSRFDQNYAKDADGGAIYINSSDDVYLIDNVFTNNRCSDEGGAIYINRDNVIVSGVIMTGNRSKNHGGAIYVDSFNDLNIQGYCRILDNHSDKKHTDNIALQDGIATRAFVYVGSIEEGSIIHIASTEKGEINLTKGSTMSQYQYSHYFVADGSTFKFINAKEKKVPFITSVFSHTWSGVTFIVGVTVIIGAFVYCLVIKRKKKKGDSEQ